MMIEKKPSELIYLRTSTDDQQPEDQLPDMRTIAGNEVKYVVELRSAWSEKQRPVFKDILKLIKGRHLKKLYVWDLDRVYRNRKRLIGFFQLCKIYGCQVYSFRQKFLDDINRMPPPFDDIVSDIFLHLLGWIAEEESDKKSERIKKALNYKEGVAFSNKGNKWGRKNISTFKRNKIIELNKKGFSIRKISRDVDVSVGSVHKTVVEIKLEKEQNNGCS